ncbi:TetR-like C-terminal domain-containing protein [Amycolatopsis echigonensis]|uniref:TetR/AcrR family transcriptional regulator C-terminal ligand-binding domain-containing protein n=1 Tax=Amycolatopsis echigonensis TaxID=2576905 RepID=A0A8E2B5Y9_9PSEU|nr:TetR-like C-terminal domain-containing protein [Amycolatopsis echigonensis]MBB2501722.1 TetR/AcrR family transcriptional regulator C-terminal ligand-binding domain-containing protein [Amycolatopsis echigonensis]
MQAPELTFAVPDTGSLRGDLVELAKQIHRLLSDPANRRVITTVVSALPDRPATAEAAGRFFADRLGREQVVFDRAHARGELADAADSEMILDLLGGNLWFRTLVRAKSADDTYLERLVDTVLTGVAR